MKKSGKKRMISKVIVVILIIILVIFVVWLLFIKNGFSKYAKANDKLNSLANTFYSYFYEDNKEETEEETIEYFSEYSDKGFSISLTNLKLYLDNRKEEDYSIFKGCDEDKTMIRIYPIKPYGEKDFTVETILTCK